jgi:TonB family protein
MTPTRKIERALLPLVASLLLISGEVAAGSRRNDAGSGASLPPVCLHFPKPDYPAVTDRTQSGDVIVQAWIDRNGRVVDAELLHSELPDPFVSEALNAAFQCHFTPPEKSGGRRGTRIALPFHFASQTSTAAIAGPPDSPPAGKEEAKLEVPEAAASTVEPDLSDERETVVSGSEIAQSPDDDAPGGDHAPIERMTAPLVDLQFGRELTGRNLVRSDHIFRTGERVYFWNRFEGAEPGSEIRHLWLLGSRVIQEIPLTIGDVNWRSWSYKTLFPGLTGEWTVEVRAADGELLGRQGFVCLPISPSG